MNVTSRRFANAVVVHAAGRLDQDTCEAFRADLLKYVEEAASGGGAIVLDLSALEYVSSAGLRCLMLAAKEGNLETVLALLEHGAAVNLRNLAGVTALGLALEGGKKNVAAALLRSGAEQ